MDKAERRRPKPNENRTTSTKLVDIPPLASAGASRNSQKRSPHTQLAVVRLGEQDAIHGCRQFRHDSLGTYRPMIMLLDRRRTVCAAADPDRRNRRRCPPAAAPDVPQNPLQASTTRAQRGSGGGWPAPSTAPRQRTPRIWTRSARWISTVIVHLSSGGIQGCAYGAARPSHSDVEGRTRDERLKRITATRWYKFAFVISSMLRLSMHGVRTFTESIFFRGRHDQESEEGKEDREGSRQEGGQEDRKEKEVDTSAAPTLPSSGRDPACSSIKSK